MQFSYTVQYPETCNNKTCVLADVYLYICQLPLHIVTHQVSLCTHAVADTGGLQLIQLQPPLKEHAPLISDD